MTNEVNFSDKTKKRIDPHPWIKIKRKIEVEMYFCPKCEKMYLGSIINVHDLPACNA